MHQRREEPSLGELFADLTREMTTLVRQEVHLATVEVGRNPILLGFLAVEQHAARARERQLGISARRRSHHLPDQRIVGRRRRDVRATLEEGQRPAAHEIDLEAEQIVLGTG